MLLPRPKNRRASDSIMTCPETCSTFAEMPSRGGADCAPKTEFSAIYDAGNPPDFVAPIKKARTRQFLLPSRGIRLIDPIARRFPLMFLPTGVMTVTTANAVRRNSMSVNTIDNENISRPGFVAPNKKGIPSANCPLTIIEILPHRVMLHRFVLMFLRTGVITVTTATRLRRNQ